MNIPPSENQRRLQSVFRLCSRVLLVGIGVLALGLSCTERLQAPVIGRPIPDFSLPTLDGKAFHVSDHRGKVVVINFWASWCPPCVEEMPSLERLHVAFRDKGLEVVAVSVDESLEDIQTFSRDHRLSFTVLHDQGAKVAHAFQTFKYPETYVVDRSGTLAWKVIGAQDWIAPAVIHDLLELTRSEGQAP